MKGVGCMDFVLVFENVGGNLVRYYVNNKNWVKVNDNFESRINLEELFFEVFCRDVDMCIENLVVKL